MMTERQDWFITKLLKERDYSEVVASDIDYNIYSTTKEEASDIIKILLECPERTEKELDLDEIRNNIYTIISKKKTKKGAILLDSINTTLNKNLWHKGQEETLTDEELMLVKDIKY